MQKAIAIDFDGCLCTNEYPNIGKRFCTLLTKPRNSKLRAPG